MKPILPIFLVLSCFAGSLCAQQTPPDDFTPDKPPQEAANAASKGKYALIMPEDKVSEAVKSTERNPFQKTAEEIQNVGDKKGTTEENNIRSHLEKLHIVGMSPGPNGMRVMLGNMVLEPGEIVPPVLADQTLSLRVGRISAKSIDLVWVEKKPTGLPERVLTLPMDISPYVRYALPGQDQRTTAQKPTKLSAMVMGKMKGDAITNAKPETPPAPVATQEAPPSPPPARAGAGPLPPTAPPTGQDPEGWKRAVGYLDDLVKLEDAKK